MTDGDADPLLELFRREVTTATILLSDGLAILAVDRDHPTDWESLERAARSIRSAALIVGQLHASDVAGAIGDAFAIARRDPTSVTATRVSDLMQAVDLLKTTSEGEPDGSTTELLSRLKSQDRSVEPIQLDASSHQPTERTDSNAASGAGTTVAAPGLEVEPSLLELFREEIRSLTGILSSGLVDLEANANDPRRIEPLMRAAHSIKGAARIVAVEPAVAIAHVMEELLVAAQSGIRLLSSSDVDALLAGVDLLAELGDADLSSWCATNAKRAETCADAIRARLAGHPTKAESQEVSSADLPSIVSSPSFQASVTTEPEVVSIDSAKHPEVPSPSTVSQQVSIQTPDQVVRVSAQSLSRLLSLAGESLVGARWLHPFAKSLLKIKRYHDHLADLLDELARNTPSRTVEDARKRLADCRDGLADRISAFESHARESDDLNSRLYREVIASRMRPFADGTHGLGRMARDVARQLGKQVRFDVAGLDTDVDRDILDKLEAPLGHIVRNAIDHGLETPEERVKAGKSETGIIRVEARHHAGMLNIRVTDDGRGIDLDKLRAKVVERRLTTPELAARMSDTELTDFLFLPGFSTASSVTDVSGRGVGLDAVQTTVQTVGGSVRVLSRSGQGTTFELYLPITLSVVRAVLVKVAGDPYALPLNRTDRLLKLPVEMVRTLEGKAHIEVDGNHVGLVPAHLIFELPPWEQTEELAVVLIADRTHQYGLVVEGFLGEQDLVVRPLDPRLGKVPNVAAASILEDSSPVLILDVDDVIRSVGMLIHEGRLRHRRSTRPEEQRRKRVLVVDDSAIVREVERQMLVGRGYEVDVAVDGVDGWNAARSGNYDLVVSDIDMPRMNGLELVRAIRSDPRVQSLPIVVISYKDREEDRLRGLEAGANYYLTKSSFHDGKFLSAVEELIGAPH